MLGVIFLVIIGCSSFDLCAMNKFKSYTNAYVDDSDSISSKDSIDYGFFDYISDSNDENELIDLFTQKASFDHINIDLNKKIQAKRYQMEGAFSGLALALERQDDHNKNINCLETSIIKAPVNSPIDDIILKKKIVSSSSNSSTLCVVSNTSVLQRYKVKAQRTMGQHCVNELTNNQQKLIGFDEFMKTLAPTLITNIISPLNTYNNSNNKRKAREYNRRYA